MFPNQKNLSHQQALSHMQSLFPTLCMPSFSASSSLKTILQSVSTSLPMPQVINHKNILHNMKSIVDSQEYKIQRNMIQIDNYNDFCEVDGCSLDFYEQRSTTIEFSKKVSGETSGNSVMSDQSEDLWWNLDQKPNSQDQLEKQCFSFLD